MTPLWRQAFNSWEKSASPLLEQATASPEFRDFLRVGVRLNKAVMAEFERASRQWLHALNVPAATDVRRLRSQVRSLEKEIHGMRRALETLAADVTLRELDALLGAEGEGLKTGDGEKKPGAKTAATGEAKNRSRSTKSISEG